MFQILIDAQAAVCYLVKVSAFCDWRQQGQGLAPLAIFAGGGFTASSCVGPRIDSEALYYGHMELTSHWLLSAKEATSLRLGIQLLIEKGTGNTMTNDNQTTKNIFSNSQKKNSYVKLEAGAYLTRDRYAPKEMNRNESPN